MRQYTRSSYPSQDSGRQAFSFPRPQSFGSWFLLGAMSAGLACMCLAVVMLGVAAYPRTKTAPPLPSTTPLPAMIGAAEGSGQVEQSNQAEEPEQVETPMQVEASFPTQSRLTSANDQTISDELGTRLSVPVGALEDGQQVEMVATQLSQTLLEELSEGYTVTSPAYQVSAIGDQDGIGRARLDLPVSDPNSRVAALIDNRYLAVLEIPAQDGYFTVLAHLGAPNAPSQYPPSGAEALPVSYFTLTPSGQSQGSLSPTDRRVGLAAPLLEDADGVSCGGVRGSHCWRNANKSVYIVWGDDYPDSLKDSEYLRVIDTMHAVELIMQTYQAFEFSAAAIGPSNPVHMRVTNSVTAPRYEPRNGVIYLPWDVVANVADLANQRTLAHELFHWIEDEEYRMILAYYSHAHSWWLEMAAEYATFMLDPGNLDHNLNAYGMTSTQQDMLGFQSSPLFWDRGEESRYIQAQLVYVSICSNPATCALSHEDFVRAINAGSYPFDDGEVLLRYQTNVKDVGLYLLGSPPQQSRADATLSPSLMEGANYGDYVLIRSVQEKRAPEYRFQYGTTPQFSRSGPDEVQVAAPIQKGGVYPLRVASDKPTGLPTYLHIEPGPAFWLRLDQRQPVFYPAGSELEVAPISDQLGYGSVRVVGIAPDADQTFRARVGFIDLAGDWLAKHKDLKVAEADCPDGEVDLVEVEGWLAEDRLLAILSGLGTYVPDPDISDGSHLIWEQQSPLEGIILESEVSLKPKAIVLEYRLVLPEAESSLRWPSLRADRGTPAAAATYGAHGLWLVPGGLLLGSAVKKRRFLLYRLALGALGATLLSGCVGLGMQGTIEGAYTFKQVERIDPDQNPYGDSRYLWRLHEGTGQIKADLTTQVSVSDLEGEETSQVSRCQMTLQSQVEAFIGADGLVPPPNLGD